MAVRIRICLAVVLSLALEMPVSAAGICSDESTCAPVGVPILMYHHIRDYPYRADVIGSQLSLSPEIFEKQLTALKDAGYHTVSFAELAGGQASPGSVVLTFDDGYDDAVTTVLPMLARHGFSGTFFIITGRIGKPGYVSEADLKTLMDAGMEIGAHTVNHRDLRFLPTAIAEQEMEGSFEALWSRRIPVSAFAYPSGKYGKGTLAILRRVGVPFAVTTSQDLAVIGRTNPLLLPRFRMQERTSMEALLSSFDQRR